MSKVDAERFLQVAAGSKATREQINAAMQSFFMSMRRANPEERLESFRALSQGIALPNNDTSAFVAMLCGAMIEQGMPAEAVADALLKRLTSSMALAMQFFDACRGMMPAGDKTTPEQFEATAKQMASAFPAGYSGWDMLGKLFPPAITLFCADANVRQRSRTMIADLSAMAKFNPGASWMSKILRVLDNEPYVAIEPATRLGIAGRFTGVSNNYQLHVLLMDRFPGASERRVSIAAAGLACGHGPQHDKEMITGCWNLNDWRALRPDGTLGDSTDAAAQQHLIRHDTMPDDIPVLGGCRVVLLSPASTQRTWPSHRDFANLRAEMTVEKTLGADELKGWLDRIVAAPR